MEAGKRRVESKTKVVFDCNKCRNDNRENETIPPCDTGAECPVGYVELLPDNVEALQWYNDIELMGWEMFRDCREIRKTAAEVELLFKKIKLIKVTINEAQRESLDE